MNGYYNLDGQARTSFSQMGEDLILAHIFREKNKGFYVDVGAYHPKQYSNTYLLYLRGWRGINIDPMPGSKDEFDKIRPDDINLELGVGQGKKSMIYYMFDQPALNGFSQSQSRERDNIGEYKIRATKKVKTFPLREILQKNLPEQQAVDFLNIDVEGMDYEVLLSNDWKRCMPEVIVIEDLQFSMGNPEESRSYRFLKKKGYVLVSKTNVSLIFQRGEPQ